VLHSYESGSRGLVFGNRSVQRRVWKREGHDEAWRRGSLRPGIPSLFADPVGTRIFFYEWISARGQSTRLTNTPALKRTQANSPRSRMCSKRSFRVAELYVMPASAARATRDPFRRGALWHAGRSPRGDLVAFTKQNKGPVPQSGVDGVWTGRERSVTASFLDEGPVWAPNGRVSSCLRAKPKGRRASSCIRSIISGRNLKACAHPRGRLRFSVLVAASK